jgi:pimeloyl-ACP methyl ester carboxylesterase
LEGRGHCLPPEIRDGSRTEYTDQDVAFANDAAHINLAGTFSVPNGKGPFPAVLLIAASGPEGRDEEVQGHHVFVVLSDYLLKRGITVLRYDKRGVGKSTGDWSKATFNGLVADADAGFQYLKGRPEVNRRRLGVIGHSEIFSTVAKTPDDAAASRHIDELVATAKADEQLKKQRTPQFVRQEPTDDPVKYVRQIRVPMLALIGTLDRIVPAELYVAVMRPILARIPGSRLEVLNGLNHVMQTAQTGSPFEFRTIEETISPVALRVIGDWISRH